jgi:hypothetical protein
MFARSRPFWLKSLHGAASQPSKRMTPFGMVILCASKKAMKTAAIEHCFLPIAIDFHEFIAAQSTARRPTSRSAVVTE